jgi:hypothetical protein
MCGSPEVIALFLSISVIAFTSTEYFHAKRTISGHLQEFPSSLLPMTGKQEILSDGLDPSRLMKKACPVPIL